MCVEAQCALAHLYTQADKTWLEVLVGAKSSPPRSRHSFKKIVSDTLNILLLSNTMKLNHFGKSCLLKIPSCQMKLYFWEKDFQCQNTATN